MSLCYPKAAESASVQNPKDPNAQCVCHRKGCMRKDCELEGVTTHLCKLVKLRKRNNYRWQTAKPLFEFSHKKKTVREPALWPLFTVCPCLSLVLWVLRLPTSCISGSSLDQFQDVLTVVQVTAMWVSRCHRWPCPACTCQRLGLWLRHDKHTTFHHTAILFLSVAAAWPNMQTLILQGLQRPNHPEAQHGLGNAMKHLAILGMVDWPARNVWQASKWKTWKKHENAEGYG